MAPLLSNKDIDFPLIFITRLTYFRILLANAKYVFVNQSSFKGVYYCIRDDILLNHIISNK